MSSDQKVLSLLGFSLIYEELIDMQKGPLTYQCTVSDTQVIVNARCPPYEMS